MGPERRHRVEELYRSARERAPEEIDSFLSGSCAGDDELRREVELLLHADRRCPIEDPTRTALGPGAQVGPYRIEAFLGRGGMGEVFRAVDTRLDRKVAIKICAAEFAGRFAREGRAIAALNHPHICTLHDVGENYLVMEYIEGVSLAHRLRTSPLPIDEVFRLGIQIADALIAAHDRGIVHRDLKPANIMMTRAGVKVLDFGLAKSFGDETLTGTHCVVGTPAYMAPEQRTGGRCDARTDIYALGIVLYEMAAGSRPDGPVAAGLPQRFARVVERCLAVDPEARWRSAFDLKSELESAAGAAPVRRRSRDRAWRIIAPVAVVAAALSISVATRFWRAEPTGGEVVRLAIPLPEEGVTANPPGVLGPPAISPDGKTVAVALGTGKNRLIWLRRFDTGRFERLPGSQGGNYPFWSPDSHQLAFLNADGKLMKVSLVGGDPQTVCSFPPRDERGATWNSSGTIVFGINYQGLYRVQDSGGRPAQFARLDPSHGENSLRNPVFLRDGLHFLCFSRTAKADDRGLYLYTLDGSVPRKKLAVTDQSIAVGRDPATRKEYALFSKSGKLWAQPIDPSRWELSGEPVAIDEDVGLFTVSDSGTLVYRRTDVEQGQYTWYDRTGRELGGVGPLVDSWGVELSPDERHAAIQYHRSLDGHFSIWLIDMARNVAAPFSAQTERSFGPVWPRDSARVYFTSTRAGRHSAFVKAVDDAGPERAFPASGATLLVDLSSDGEYFLGIDFRENGRKSVVYSRSGTEKWTPLAETEGSQTHAKFSPDGHWVAYDSTESGVLEIYVVDFPAAQRKVRISVAGGKEPRWSGDGKEIVYYAPEGALMSVGFTGAGPAAQPQRLFNIRFSTDIDGFHYTLSRDGRRVLAMKELGRERSRDLNVVMNWPRLLNRDDRR
jgi:serine/threonine protein kinase